MRRWPSGRRQQSPKLPEFISHVSSNLSLRAINLRESFNGRKAVSKTVNEGSIPSSRAIRIIRGLAQCLLFECAPCGSSSMVERYLPKVKAAGSSPVYRSKHFTGLVLCPRRSVAVRIRHQRHQKRFEAQRNVDSP